jgi:hypothetical protein
MEKHHTLRQELTESLLFTSGRKKVSEGPFILNFLECLVVENRQTPLILDCIPFSIDIISPENYKYSSKMQILGFSLLLSDE